MQSSYDGYVRIVRLSTISIVVGILITFIEAFALGFVGTQEFCVPDRPTMQGELWPTTPPVKFPERPALCCSQAGFGIETIICNAPTQSSAWLNAMRISVNSSRSTNAADHDSADYE